MHYGILCPIILSDLEPWGHSQLLFQKKLVYKEGLPKVEALRAKEEVDKSRVTQLVMYQGLTGRRLSWVTVRRGHPCTSKLEKNRSYARQNQPE